MGRIDTTDMHAIHNVFRLACRDAPGILGGGDGRHEAVASFYGNVLAFLRAHHGAEDALLLPLLVQRCPSRASLVGRMEAQHEAVTASLERAEAQLARWRTAPSEASKQDFASALGDLGAQLGAHLDEEEEELLPLAADHLTREEWGALPGHAMAHFSGEKWLIIGLAREQMTDAQRAHMLEVMPPPAREAWLNSGRQAFAALTTSLRGS